MKLFNRFLVMPTLLIMLSTAACVPAYAYEPPAEVQQGDITYVTGGIGQRDNDAMRAEHTDYVLHIVNANTEGEFAGDVQIILLDSKGYELLNVNAGPLLYANLPAGKYTVMAKDEERTQIKSIAVVGKKSIIVRFNW